MQPKKSFVLTNGWSLEEICTREQIEASRSVWQSLQTTERYPAISSDIDRYLSVWEAVGSIDPYIVILRENTQPKAMVIGRLGQETIRVKFGYKTVLKPKLNCFSVVYGGVLGQPDMEVSTILVRGLIEIMNYYHLDCINFDHLRADTVFYQKLRNISGVLCRNHFSVLESHWRMKIPENIDEFYSLRSKKHKKHLKQYQNKLERKYSGKVVFHTYQKLEEADQAIKDASTISMGTYQSALGAGITDGMKTCILLKNAAQKGWFEGNLLYINNDPVAFRFALKYCRTYFGDGIGYDTAWADFRVGTILFIKVLEKLCKDRTVDYYDFGFGDAEYKSSYGTEYWYEARISYLFAARIYPLLINGLISFNDGLVLGLTGMLKKIGIYEWIKRLWKSRLTKSKKLMGDDN